MLLPTKKSDPINITVDPAELNFGSIVLNKTSEEKSALITVTNFRARKYTSIRWAR